MAEEFKGNSHKIKQDTKKEEVQIKIHESKPIPEKKADSGFTKKAENFLTPIVDDVIIPSAQDTVIDIAQSIMNGIMNGIISAITGEPSNRDYNVPIRRHSRNGRTDYNAQYRSSSRTVTRRNRDEVTESTRLKDLKVDSRADAISVIEQLRAILDEYNQVTCNDLYGLEEIDKSCPYTYTNYGWTNLDDAGIINNGNGTWSFDLPRPVALNK